MPKTIMIITGESSGELYGALLAGSIRRLYPEARILGVGGEQMKKAGVEVFSDIASAFGLVEALSSFNKVKDTFDKTIEALKIARPDVLVLIDYPDFNFRVAKAAKRMGIRILYYVSPQVWAWRKGRVKTIASLVDKVAVILPFEEAIYRNARVPCEFVGHPALDEINTVPKGKDEAKSLLGLDSGRPYIALLPGSRSVELRRLLPLMLNTVREYKKENPKYGFVMPLAPNLDYASFKEYFERLEGEGVRLVKGNALLALSASEAAVIASGTAALQAAFIETPMVVVYKVSPISYLIAKMILDIKYITIVNLLLDRPVVAELIQSRANAQNVVSELGRLTGDIGYRNKMLDDLRFARSLFSGKNPSQRVAEMIGEMTAGANITAR